MSALDLIEKIKEKDYHQDIVFLKNRLIELFDNEEYEKIGRVEKWIEELINHYHSNY
jgi:hypothetical protein